MDRRRTLRDENTSSPLDFFNPTELWFILKHHWLIAILTFAVIIVPGVMYVMAKPSIYEATATIVLENSDVEVRNISDNSALQTIDATDIDTQVALIRSPELAERTAEKLNLYYDKNSKLRSAVLQTAQKQEVPSDARFSELNDTAQGSKILSEIGKQLIISQIGKSRVIGISYRSTDPEFASALANTHTQAYVNGKLEAKDANYTRLNDWLSNQINELKQDTAQKTEAVESKRKQLGLVRGSNSEDLFYQQVSDIASELVPVETKKFQLQARYSALLRSGVGASNDVLNSPLIQNLKSQASQLKQDLNSMATKYRPTHPEYRSTQRRYDQIKSDLDREIADVTRAVKTELDAAISQEKLLRGRLKALKAEAGKLEDNRAGMEGLLIEEQASQKLLDSFLKGFGEIQSKIDLPQSNVRIVSLSRPPLVPIAPKRKLLLVLLGLFAGFTAIAAVFAYHFLRDTILTADDVRKGVKLRLIGMLPSVAQPGREVFNLEKSHYLSEIRRIYLYLTNFSGAQSILISSTNAGEGKTTVATSLAYYMRTLGKRVILIESDSYAPVDLEQAANKTSSADYNALTADAEHVTNHLQVSQHIKTDPSGVDILPLMTSENDVSEKLLLSDQFPVMLEQLKESYDYLIIDSSAIMLATDAEVIAGKVNHIFLVTEWGKTTKRQLKHAAEIIRKFTDIFPCVILNKIGS